MKITTSHIRKTIATSSLALLGAATLCSAEAEQSELREEEASVAEREFRAARRYSGKTVGRSSSRVRSSRTSRSREKDWGESIGSMLKKELTGTTGRRIVRGILGGLFKGR